VTDGKIDTYLVDALYNGCLAAASAAMLPDEGSVRSREVAIR
jgi:hypothetical protein